MLAPAASRILKTTAQRIIYDNELENTLNTTTIALLSVITFSNSSIFN